MIIKQIKLSAKLEVDAVEYASRANAILGIRDSGKTYTGTLIAEQLFDAEIPIFAFDPIGRWRFLRSPGKGPNARGFPIVVAGGAQPDLPLTPESAPELIRAAMRSGVSMVLDLYSIGLSKSDWRKIVRTAIETILYEGEGHGLRHIFLEEAAEFIPQHVRDGQTYAAVEKLARMGGNVGVGVTLINQRAEEVNKAVLELCDNLLLHRQRGKNSLLSLRKWLDAGNIKPPKEITDSLADLGTGHCWAWFKDHGRPLLIKVNPKRSFDPDRRAMSRTSAKGTPAAIDVSTFVTLMKNALAGKKVAPVPISTAIHVPHSPAGIIPPPGIISTPKEEVQVNEKEAQALRDENKRLSEELSLLRASKATTLIASGGEGRSNAQSPAGEINVDALYAEIKRRAATDPGVLAILTARPEIEVRVERKIVQIDGTSLKGRIAKLIATGFFGAEGKSNSSTRTELRRTGPDTNNANIARVLAELVRDGFLTAEGSQFRAVEEMKVNVVEM